MEDLLQVKPDSTEDDNWLQELDDLCKVKPESNENDDGKQDKNEKLKYIKRIKFIETCKRLWLSPEEIKEELSKFDKETEKIKK